MSKSKEEVSCQIVAIKAQASVKKMHKEALFRLAKAEKGRKSVKAAVASIEKQAKDQCCQLQTTEEQLVLTQEKIEIKS